MRHLRQHRIKQNPTNKQNQLTQNITNINSNLPNLRNNNNNNNHKHSLKNQYHLNLHQRKKTYLNLYTKKQNTYRNNNNNVGNNGMGKNCQNTKCTIQSTRLGERTLTTQLSGLYLSSRQRQRQKSDKISYKSITTKVVKHQKYQILQKHQINIKMRAKMIDWLLQIIQAYQCKNQTFFLAIYFMDQYFTLCDRMLKISQLHLIGVTCIYMACKYQEIHPINIKTIVKDIAHNKITTKDIIGKQAEILITLGFNCSGKCMYLIGQQILYNFISKIQNSIPFTQISMLQKYLEYYLKLITFNCNLSRQQNPILLANAAILASIGKISQDITNCQLLDSFISSYKLENESLHHVCSQILFLYVNFKNQFGQLDNIEKMCPFLRSKGLNIVSSCAL